MSFQPKGQSLRLNKEQIAAMSVVTARDVAEAVKLWKKLMPDRWKSLLQAKHVRL